MRNEAGFIRQCLMSVLESDYPGNLLEIIVVDGMSTDGSREVVREIRKTYGNVILRINRRRITPVAFNRGIRTSKGMLVCILSAHGCVGKQFFARGVQCLHELPDVDVVGGPARSVSRTFLGKSIACVVSSRFGTGSFFRYGSKSRYVDTVPFPLIRKDVFARVGWYNETLARNQDNEFNSRFRKHGGKIYFCPEMDASVFVRCTLASFLRYNFMTGKWNVFTNRICRHAFSLRHFVPACFLLGLAGSLLLFFLVDAGKILFMTIALAYGTADLFSSLMIGIKNGMKYSPVVPFLFFLLHISYGLGTLWALLSRWKPHAIGKTP